MYEFWKAHMIPRRKKIITAMTKVRRDIENGEYKKVPSGKRI